MGQARFCPSRLLSLTPLFVLRQKPRPALALAVFSFLYLKKIKISKIYVRFEIFQKYPPVAPP